MAKIFKNFFPYILVLLISLFLLTFKLAFSPVHLNQDEAMFALNAKSIADNGRDFYGNKLPFYFWHLDNFWATPLLVYWSSLFLKFLPFSEAGVRFPSAFLGFINVGLMMYLAHLVFKKKYLTLMSGVLLLATPAFFINSRLMLDNIYPVFFVLMWLIFLSRKNYFLAGLMLGLGFHSYHAGKIYFPLYFIGTLIFGYIFKWLDFKKSLLILIGFSIPLIVFIPWLVRHPDTLSNQVSYATSIDKNLGSNLIVNYISYFDPAILFSTGDRTLIHSTGRVGLFLFPLFFFLILGVIYAVKEKNLLAKLSLFGLFIYPLAPSIISDPGRISRALVIIPFAVLFALYGIKFMVESREKLLKPIAYVIFALCVLTFLFFLSDYFGNYRVRSHPVFNNDIGGVLESVLRSTKIRPVKKVYIDKNIFQVKYYLEFYERKLNIYPSDVIYFDFEKENFTVFPVYSIVVVSQKVANSGNFNIVETIREPDGTESYFIYWRDK